jgi:hypothetical protein
VTALTARRVRYGVGPDLICQLGPSPGIKTHSSPSAFPTTLSLSFCLLPSYTAPSCLRPHRAPLTPLLGPLVPTEPIRRGPWEKCRSATADSYSLDASATLSRRPSNPSIPNSDADEASGVPAGHQRLGHATALDARTPLPLSSFVHQSITPPVSTVVD